MAETLTMPPLKKAMWSCSSDGNGTLDGLLAKVASVGSLAGVAYTTARARAITSVSDGRLRASDGAVEEGTVYEVRIWKTCPPPDGPVLAHEWRWLNGSGSAEITVWTMEEGKSEGESCWYRKNAYLQLGASEPFDKPGDTMTSIEVFTEAEYGNTVFTDELMTGEWG